MFRDKTIIGPKLKSRKFTNQKTESATAIHCLNAFTALGMPVSKKIDRGIQKRQMTLGRLLCNNALSDNLTPKLS